jgi:hypothetical protein
MIIKKIKTELRIRQVHYGELMGISRIIEMSEINESLVNR